MFRIRSLLALIAVVSALVFIAAEAADARAGRGASSGSRGSRTYSMPPSTKTSPGTTSQFDRTATQPRQTTPSAAAAGAPASARPGMFGGGLLGGLAAGFLGAGLIGMLFGNGFLGGMAGFASFLGMIAQIGLIALVAWFAFRWWKGRTMPAFAGAATGGAPAGSGPASTSSRFERLGFFGGGGGAPGETPLEIQKEDFDAFERLLTEIETAYGNEDTAALRERVTPEMLSYFSDDLSDNASRGIVNKVSDIKLLQGDLSEAWREGSTDYATVAMRYSIDDRMVERATGRSEGGQQEVTEVWTFTRAPGSDWILSAIQQS